MKKLIAKPVARLAGRALLAGVFALAAQLQASSHLDASVLRAALVAGGLAAFEAFTPLNALVGFGKTPAK